MDKDVLKLFLPANNADKYFKELQQLASPVFSGDFYEFFKPFSGINNISPKTDLLLTKFIPDLFNIFINFQIPFCRCLHRIAKERPWELLSSEGVPGYEHVAVAIPTYEELFDLLHSYSDESAIRILEQMSKNSSHRNAIITAYKKGNINEFIQVVENTKEDYTDYMNSLYYNRFLLFLGEIMTEISKGEETEVQLGEVEEYVASVGVEGVRAFLTENTKRFTGQAFDFVDIIREEANYLYTAFVEIRRAIMDCQELETMTEREHCQMLAMFIDKYNIDRIIEDLNYLMGMFTAITCMTFIKLKPGMFPQELKIINDLIFKSPYPEDINNLCDELQHNSNQGTIDKPQLSKETHNDYIELTDALGDIFLPEDFFSNYNIKRGETDCFGELRQCVIDAGYISLNNMINFIAINGFIDDTLLVKRDFAFRLTGYHSDYAGRKAIRWHGKTNIISFLIKNFYDGGKMWKNATQMMELDDGRYFYREGYLTTGDIDKNFKELFSELYPNVKLR